MRPRWDDVNARVRGLGSRRLSPEALAGLARSADLQSLARGLEALGVLPGEIPDATASALDLALRRAAGHEVRVVRRWLGARDRIVAVALDAEDRRSLRALVRGAMAGTNAEARLSGLIPTPALPERLLEELAQRTRVSEQAALLVAARHPAGPPLLAASSERVEPDLYALELILARTFAERAVAGARRGGGLLRHYVGTVVDLENCRTALLLVAGGAGESAASSFIPGGRQLSLAEFERAAAAPDPARAARVMHAALDGGTLARLPLSYAAQPPRFEDAADKAMLAWLRHHARLDPLSAAPLLLYFHRLRLQTEALAELVWSIDLGMPVSRRGAPTVGSPAG